MYWYTCFFQIAQSSTVKNQYAPHPVLWCTYHFLIRQIYLPVYYTGILIGTRAVRNVNISYRISVYPHADKFKIGYHSLSYLVWEPSSKGIPSASLIDFLGAVKNFFGSPGLEGLSAEKILITITVKPMSTFKRNFKIDQ